MVMKVDNVSRLSALLGMNKVVDVDGASIPMHPDDDDAGQSAMLKRKVISLGRNVLRIVESGNRVNQASISQKITHYRVLLESDLKEDAAQQDYLDLLNAINDVI